MRFLLGILMTCVSMDAIAQIRQTDPNGGVGQGRVIPVGQNLPRIFRAVGEDFNARQAASLVPEVFTPSQSLKLTLLATGGGYRNLFGWYNLGDDVDDPDNRHVVFGCPDRANLNAGQTPIRTIDFCAERAEGRWKGGPIGFFIVTPQIKPPGGGTSPNSCAPNSARNYAYYTEPRLSDDDDANPYIHHLVFRSDVFDNAFYFGFEDLFRGGDDDFEDVLVLVEGLLVGNAPEACNGVDDDCDGRVDENASVRCETECGSGLEVCQAGQLLTCNAPEAIPEACNALDDDCDGVVDEDAVRPCSTLCGQGTEVCQNGEYAGCTAPQPRAERCDSIDNDCDLNIDEGVVQVCQNACGVEGVSRCINGEFAPCDAPPPVAETCNGQDDDCDGITDENVVRTCMSECGQGVERCENGVFSVCDAALPEAEACDGRDNDCDGVVDEQIVRPCEQCGDVGEERCVAGVFLGCSARSPLPERCNGGDDDCDGVVDENTVRECENACGTGQQLCTGGQYDACTAPQPINEDCDGLDNDCDGRVDEAIVRPCNSECGGGIELCQMGTFSGCDAPSPVEEICDGLDNDCDGKLDEDESADINPEAPDEVIPLSRGCRQCGEQGREQCIGGTYTGCTARRPLENELCNGIDDDCDGAIDEDLDRACNDACGNGVQRCVDGQYTRCDAPNPAVEVCDNVDQDCDGRIDENLSVACATACGPGARLCANGAFTECDAPIPTQETCNNEDDDCDGSVDEAIETVCSTACGTGTAICVEGALTACSAREPTDELCDGIDNDCDSAVDEMLMRTCTTPCGEGMQTCQNGRWGECPTTEPRPELCNAQDDNCNGIVDEDAECAGRDICRSGTCVEPCTMNECTLGFECIDGYCDPVPCLACRAYEICRADNCVDPCADIECPEDSYCLSGECTPGDCYDSGCETGKVCVSGRCKPDDCAVQNCGAGQGCRMGMCFSSCLNIECADGERCVNGACVADSCDGLECGEGLTCVDASCEADPCQGIECGPGRICGDGTCLDDPCLATTCPAGSECFSTIAGVSDCRSTEQLQREQTDESEMAPTDASAGLDAGASTSGGTAANDVESTRGSTGGCQTSPTTPSIPWTWLLGVMIWLGLSRRSIVGTIIALVALGCAENPGYDDGSTTAMQDESPAQTSASPSQVADCVPSIEVCNGVDDDCNDIVDDVADLSSNVNDCGQCGNQCVIDNAEPTCIGGQCRVRRCAAGFVNADGLSANGCESECTPSTDAIEVCNERDDDCDGLADEGFNLGGDIDHCGLCGRSCLTDGVESAECISGRCVITECTEGRTNLDGRVENGCESRCSEDNDESCNGQDDDCDGKVDEDLVIDLTCKTEGLCAGAEPRCLGAEGFGCTYPSGAGGDNELRCDGLDNDCDGNIDEDFVGLGDACDGDDEDVCMNGTIACTNDGVATFCREVRGGVERCDGIDNDCDTAVDEGFDLQTDVQNCGRCGLNCQTLNSADIACAEGMCILRTCQPGFIDLDADPSSGCEYPCRPTGDETDDCDGQDDDCDGRIDEDSGNAPQQSCLTQGVCAGSVPLCLGPAGYDCSYPAVYSPDRERRCDGLDNDCDGKIDEDFEALGAACDGDDEDSCKAGIIACTNDATGTVCTDTEASSVEACDGLDNDCDTLIDEDFNLATDVEHCGACNVPCGRPNAQTACRASECVLVECIDGFSDVNGLLIDGCEETCAPQRGDEQCNGLDDDCDGLIDENVEPQPNNVCLDVGVCRGSQPVCLGARGFTCNYPSTYGANAETRCDGLDNDCDGRVDEDFGAVGQLCDGPDADLCKTGILVCDDDQLSASCSDDEASVSEICDGADNDCDGSTDEGFELDQDEQHCGVCNNRCERAGALTSCQDGQCQIDSCLPGFTDGNTSVVDGCEQPCALNIGEETCNGIDDDCDGKTDEDLTAPFDCAGAGECQGLVPLCLGAAGFQCPYPDTYEANEVTCDDLDNDCDGLIDEASDNAQLANKGAACSVGLGACQKRGTFTCNEQGDDIVCPAIQEPAAEIELCNGIDDDCDGRVDENVPRDTEMVQIPGLAVYIDKYEASRADARADQGGFLTAYACSRQGVLPWVNLTHNEASAACIARGKRLCTDDEWSRACGIAFPYGDVYDPNICHTERPSSRQTGVGPDCVANGIYDMSGNVAEWAECARDVDCQVVRPVLGGSFSDRIDAQYRCDFRGNSAPQVSTETVGFRCCVDMN